MVYVPERLNNYSIPWQIRCFLKQGKYSSRLVYAQELFIRKSETNERLISKHCGF